MPLTVLFDETYFDPDKFDTKNQYSVTIEETKTKFDSVLFDSAVFDTTAGGVINVTDLLARVQNLNTTLSEATTVTDSLSRLQAIFRTISESTITVSDSISRLLSTFRSMSDSISITDSVVRSIPINVRYIYDLGDRKSVV